MSSNEKCASCTKDQLEIRRLDAGLSECGSVECPRRRTLTASHCGQPANRSWSDELGTDGAWCTYCGCAGHVAASCPQAKRHREDGKRG